MSQDGFTTPLRSGHAVQRVHPAPHIAAALAPEQAPSSPELVLIRGLPGSGKSTRAKKMVTAGYAHLEADMYFIVGGTYRYDASRIRDAHAWCQSMTRQALHNGQSVVVSNTFTTLRELAPYLAMARNLRIEETRGKWDNTHGVPAETISKMAARWETLPAHWR